VKLPGPVGATVTDPLVACAPVKAPPLILEVLAVQDVALLDVQASLTACPKVMVAADAGEVKVTVIMEPPPPPPPPPP
jgi:chorismate mutase